MRPLEQKPHRNKYSYFLRIFGAQLYLISILWHAPNKQSTKNNRKIESSIAQRYTLNIQIQHEQ